MMEYPYNLYSDMVGEKVNELSSSQIGALDEYVLSMPTPQSTALYEKYHDKKENVGRLTKWFIRTGLYTLMAYQPYFDNGEFYLNEMILNKSIKRLDLSNRALNCLNREGLTTVEKVAKRINDFAPSTGVYHWYDTWKHCGISTAKEIQNALINAGVMVIVDPTLSDYCYIKEGLKHVRREYRILKK